jgi:type VI protein secretion system component VasF
VAAQRAWNRPVWWPLALLVVAALVVAWYAWLHLRRRERVNGRGELLADLGASALPQPTRGG